MSNDYSHLIAEVRRERQTEERIRQNDAADTVAEIHALEDKIEALEAERDRLREALRCKDSEDGQHEWAHDQTCNCCGYNAVLFLKKARTALEGK